MKNGNNKAGRTHKGGGLYLQVGESGSASWLLRYQRGTKINKKGEIAPAEHWMGLGPKSRFTLKEAKARARKAQQQLSDNIDPLQARREQRALEALEASRTITFADAAKLYYAGHEKKWSSHKHRQAFLNTLKQYADPVIGNWPVAAVDIAAVLKIVEPIWITKNQTASRLRGRIQAILDWCTVRGYRSGDNPARWELLEKVLPTGGEIAPVVHHRALAYADVPAFVAQLSQHQGIAPKALEFIILTALRTSEVLKARWSEFDFDNNIWTIPGPRMKARKPHRVPLTRPMIKLLKSLPHEGDDNSLVFIGTKANTPIGKMTLPKLVDAMKYDVTIHGFRASFKSWATEQTSYPDSMIEFSLAHTVGSATEQAYQRSDMVEKRRQLMEQWSTFISTPRKIGTVTPIRGKAGV
jgi:integrase